MRWSRSARITSAVKCIFLGLLLGVQGVSASGVLGTFTEESSRVPYAPDSTTLVTDVELVDLDGDGDLDLWIARGTLNGGGRKSQFWRNNGMGSFTLAAKFGGTTEDLDHTDAAFGDLDGNGFPDVVEAINLGGERVKFNNGAGGLQGKKGAFLDTSTDVTISVVLFDADGDGDLDIGEANECPQPVCTAGGAQNTLWINNGVGHFTNETASRLPAVLDQTSALVAGDIDGDGDRDLIAVNGRPSGAQSLVLVNDGTGHFSDETAQRLPAQLLSGRDGALVDIDGDGDRDLILITSRQSQSRIYLNNGAGVFTDVTATHFPVYAASFQEVDAIDLDGNGVVDLLFCSDVGATIDGQNHIFAGALNRLWENDGTGHFTDITDAHLPVVVSQTFSSAIGDIDGDGDFDIIAAAGKGEPIRVYIQN